MSQLQVNRINDASGGVLAPISSVMRNRIINGSCTIDQRNAGASVTPVSNQYLVDRWCVQVSQASKITAQQNAGSVTPPVGFTNYQGITSSSAYTLGSVDYFAVQQRIEGYNMADLGWGTANAKTITLSAWVYSSLTGTFGGSIINGGSTYSYPFSYTISSANTWTQISVTITGPTSGTWLTTNGIGAFVLFGLGVGATLSGTAGSWSANNYLSATGATSVVGTNGATFYITGVQLEVGTQATSFEYRQYTTELQLAQRYFQRASKGTVGTCFGSTDAVMSFPLLVEMRANPSAGYLTGSTSSIDVIGAAQNGTITPNGANGSKALFSATVSSLSGRSNGNPVIYTDTNLFFSSEL